jgi:hypothetical protein
VHGPGTQEPDQQLQAQRPAGILARLELESMLSRIEHHFQVRSSYIPQSDSIKRGSSRFAEAQVSIHDSGRFKEGNLACYK